ncbi:MAG: hypothetical protein KGJ09_07360 [Candidatus Omnitrophica bacterium]|nr:hypothetical protein [Candidatus Omnitrophota bacterium]MDE2009880.1 hypothetical protein [Candidatus Omnitrophota bacterium]MDE2214338.1 hypothetical protein [Candidatus Omnitrophota bacterium]MDE2231087.1 hypothetical protein [Candidatus Omnitrophota bacterium]
MKIILLIVFLLFSCPLWAEEGRYLHADKVFYETPLAQDVMNVHLALGYCTVLQFPEKPILVTVGDNSLVQVEIPKNSKSVVIKPLQDAGETNLFVFTPNHRFNYNVIIADAAKVDYVLDTKSFNPMGQKARGHLSVERFIKLSRQYAFLETHNAINDREFRRKKISCECSYPDFDVNLIEAFSRNDPNYLVMHISVTNTTNDEVLDLTEQKTVILVNNHKFIPQYVLFDNDQLFPDKSTDGWLVLENSYISLDNEFSLSLGVGEKEYVCKQSIS